MPAVRLRSATLAAMLAAAPALAATGAPAPARGNVTRAQLLAQVKKTFQMADTNHDGFMSRAEFGKRMGVVISDSGVQTKQQAQQMLDAANRAFDNVDANHDGKLSLAEASARPLRAFDMMDTNHDGVLTLAEKVAAHRDAPPVAGPSANPSQGPGR